MSADQGDQGLSEARTALGLQRSALTLVVGVVMGVRLLAEGLGMLALVVIVIPAVPVLWGLTRLSLGQRPLAAPALLVASAVACIGLGELALLNRGH